MSRRGPKPKPYSLNTTGRKATFYVSFQNNRLLDAFMDENPDYKKSQVVNEALFEYLSRRIVDPVRTAGDAWTVVSLFSGCGGFDLGFAGDFEYLGSCYDNHSHSENNQVALKPFEIVFAIDIKEEACIEYAKFFGFSPTCGDVKEFLNKVENGSGDSETSAFPRECDVVLGGFPCQDFSVSGKRKGLGSERGRLYQQMKRAISICEPKVFIAENVKGIINLRNAVETIKMDFQETGKHGYHVTHHLVNAADYGVPQTRERVIFVGVRRDMDPRKTIVNNYFPPDQTHTCEEDGQKWVTAKEAIHDLLGKPNLPNQHQYSKARNYGEHCQGNRPIPKDYPSITIRAEHHGNIEFHYDESVSRRLTIRECARLQSFPDNYVFHCSQSKAYKLIGDAVPPVLGWHVAQSVAKLLAALEKNGS